GTDYNYQYSFFFEKNRPYGSILQYLGYSIGLMWCVLFGLSILINPSDSWGSRDHPIAFVFGVGINLFLWGYLIPKAIWHLFSTMICTRKIITILEAKKALKLRPLCPDGAAGLAAFGRLSLSMISITIVPMIALVVIFAKGIELRHASDYIGALPMIFYMLLIILIFFLPLSSAHNAMSTAKEKELKILGEEFNKAYEIFSREIKKKGITDELQKSVEYMNRIGSLYDHVEKMAVWPFDIQVMAQFIFTFMLPLITLIIVEYIPRYLHL
ncbi:MAG: hypothetical protein V1934_01260, partial [Methanobacteriota archaeon]